MSGTAELTVHVLCMMCCECASVDTTPGGILVSIATMTAYWLMTDASKHRSLHAQQNGPAAIVRP
jgi:hypothetical protein